MAVQVTPITPALPATTAIQDPAARRFAQAVQDALKAMQSSEAALEGLAKAASALLSAPPGGVPPSIADWLFASELYRKLTERIERVDLDTKRAFIDEALALAEEYDPERTYAKDEVVRLDGVFYRSLVDENLGNEPPNGDFWAPSGIFQTLGEAIAALVEVERTARVTEVDATTANIDAAVSRIGTAEAAITSEETTRATNDLAIVQALDTLWTISGASKALSQDSKNLITNWQTATAQEWQTLQAEVLDAGGNTLYAAVAAESQARASFEGKVAASWMVKAEVDVGTGKPYVAGIALGAEGQGDSATSEFLVRADKFALVMPGYDEHVPFAIGNFGPEFSGLTSWSNVTGANKPQDGATRNVFQGDWTTSTSYAVGDIVLKDGNGWSCTQPHTSSSSNQPPASGNGNDWWALYAVKGSDGAQGLHALTVLVPNNAHTLPAASDGVVASYTGSGTTIQVFEGTTALSAVSSITANGQFTIGTPTQVPASTITVGAQSYVGTTATVAQHSAMVAGTDSVVVTYPITVRRTDGTTVTLSATQTLTKSKAGAQGVDGAPGPAGPAVVVTADRALSFTATDGTLDGSQADIVLTASVSGIPSPTYAWTFSGLQTNPTASTTSSQTITAAQFGTSKSATVTCTVNGSYVDQVTIVRLEKSTAAAGADVTSQNTAAAIAGQGAFATLSQITTSNVTTYIANAAIGAAQIGSINLVGTSNFAVKTATSGARMDMDSRRIKVYDADGVLRVQLGDLTV